MLTGPRCVVARGVRHATGVIPPRQATLIISFAMLLMLAVAWYVGLREDVGEAPPPSAASMELVRAAQMSYENFKLFPNSNSRLTSVAHEKGLPAGSPKPPLTAPGWINGEPDASDLDGKVLVIDVWDGLCPYCSLAAPALIDAYNRFHQRGVVFVGFTTADEDESRMYVDYWHIPWANGFNADTTIDSLRADAPTLLVIGPRGRVLWNDDRARWRHDIDGLGAQLDRAIENALARNQTATPNGDTL